MSGVDGQGRPGDTVGLREALARAYPLGDEDPARNPEAWEVADALLPAVTAWAEQRARERAAEELRAAAAEFCQGADEPYDLHTTYCVRFYLRASALDADDRTGQR